MEQMHISPNFINRTREGAARVSFQFSVVGNRQAGVSYITANIAPGADLMAEARKAAKKACKRAGATEATLCAIVAPVR